jgi:hypothetical protein
VISIDHLPIVRELALASNGGKDSIEARRRLRKEVRGKVRGRSEGPRKPSTLARQATFDVDRRFDHLSLGFSNPDLGQIRMIHGMCTDLKPGVGELLHHPPRHRATGRRLPHH